MTIILSLIAWGLVVGFVCSLGVASVEGWKQLRRMHQVPCSRCVYFTGDYNLKCTVRPCDALTEQAIDCRDFEVVTRKRPRFENPIPKEIWKYFHTKVNFPKIQVSVQSSIEVSSQTNFSLSKDEGIPMLYSDS